ncbi:hypothetical protein PL10110_470021 [Planktothrix agardhii]|nr:hypothetical protein PL10110_470021 [Planktothrix agardhii]
MTGHKICVSLGKIGVFTANAGQHLVIFTQIKPLSYYQG